MTKGVSILLVALVVSVSGGLASAQPDTSAGRFVSVGAVYTASNAADANQIVIFDRAFDGRLRAAGAVATGGTGTGEGLGNQSGLVLSQDERWLVVVNAGSEDLSVFQVRRHGLELTSQTPSGGSRPISVTMHGRLVYVLNAGSENITGFSLNRRGVLEPLPSSTRPLSGKNPDPAQIAFSPDGDLLVVTEKGTNQIVTYRVGRNGLPGAPHAHPSAGTTPFGFAFGHRDELFVSEAFGGGENQSALSSYELEEDGELQTVSASVGTNQTAACWAIVTPNGRFAYTTNTGSGSLTGFAIGFDGELTRLDQDGRTGVTGDGSAPIDMALSRGGRFLYALASGTGEIVAFHVTPTGALVPLTSTGGLPPSVDGLAAR